MPISGSGRAGIVLSIKGDDAWRPISVVMFGLDTASGNPTRSWSPRATRQRD